MTEVDDPQRGYRFIYRRPDGSLQSRPAVIHSAAQLLQLFGLAASEGWLIQCEMERAQTGTEAVTVEEQVSEISFRET